MPLTYIDPTSKLRKALPIDTIDHEFKDIKNLMTRFLNEISFLKKKDMFYLDNVSVCCEFQRKQQWTVISIKNTKKTISYHCVSYLPLNKKLMLVPDTTTFSVNHISLDTFLNTVLNDIRELWKNDNPNS